MAIELLRKRSITHGARIGRLCTRTYKAWSHAKARCANPSDEKYPIYGGRGIRVCKRWRDDFAAFLADMGECPEGLTLDRKNVNGNYTPRNCRWATPREQSNNVRRNIIVRVKGKNMTLKQAAELLELPYKWLHYRVRTRGATLEEAAAHIRAVQRSRETS